MRQTGGNWQYNKLIHNSIGLGPVVATSRKPPTSPLGRLATAGARAVRVRNDAAVRQCARRAGESIRRQVVSVRAVGNVTI